MNRSNLNDEMGHRVRVLRKARGITQESLGKRIRMSRAMIVNLENGRGNWSLWRLVQIAAAFKVEVWQICHPQWQTVLGIEETNGAN